MGFARSVAVASPEGNACMRELGVCAHLELLEVDGAVAVLVLELELARHELLVPRRVRGEDVKVVEQLAHLSLPVWVGRIASSVSVDG
jgi:hypothetical protein